QIQSLWIGNKLSLMEQLSICSFLHNGYNFHLYTYTDVANIPSGTTVRDAAEILPENWITRFRYSDSPSPSPFSNLFRYKLLNEKGGIWVDLDVICLRRFSLKHDYCFPFTSGMIMFNRDPSWSVDGWFLLAPKGCEMMRYCYETALSHADQAMSWGQIG